MINPISTSPAPQIYELQEVITDGKYLYCRTKVFTASTPGEVEDYVHHTLEDYCICDYDLWTLQNQWESFTFPEDDRTIRIQVNPIADIFKYFGIESFRPQYSGKISPQSVWLILEALLDYKRAWYERGSESRQHSPNQSLGSSVDEALKAEKAALEIRMLHRLSLDQVSGLPL